MWNVSESTVKRWADSPELTCSKTPGGHRRFTVADIQDFQARRGFEANGLLTTVEWEDPSVETSLNKKDFEEVSEQIFYLACQNQRLQIRDLLVRLLLRGITMAHIYDKVLAPVLRKAREEVQADTLAHGQYALVHTNLEETLCYVAPQVVRKRPSGRMGLCATADPSGTLPVTAASRVLEVEGWECLNLGSDISYEWMAETVRLEPVNLVCAVSSLPSGNAAKRGDLQTLTEATSDYRIPLVFFGEGFAELVNDVVLKHDYLHDLESLRSLVSSLART
jgi:methanogenic corrinoid protein MtbC1